MDDIRAVLLTTPLRWSHLTQNLPVTLLMLPPAEGELAGRGSATLGTTRQAANRHVEASHP